jgi:RNase P protein component
VYEEGVKEVGRLFVLYLYPGDDLARAVVASRKVGGAVARNRAKRLLREAIRSRIEKEPATVAEIRRRFLIGRRDPAVTPGEDDPASGEGLWLVMVARRRILDVKSHEVAAELDRLLHRPPAPAPEEP